MAFTFSRDRQSADVRRIRALGRNAGSCQSVTYVKSACRSRRTEMSGARRRPPASRLP
ncbi:hypothetical protein XFF6992_140143 [Xanthomonas citri pv. fuscans]|uniref:Uncharacterized protein n=1 Tax=Xanthomonas campestris pv. phaseoli TaxID=317013 RepID=A0A7Z7NF04_XANCH|nr:hypothetical protein XFF6990_140530 [Xanthomonas citri pv. fuscans]SOO17183.1 hypothetical protein XFF6992_140143 [Xanthomonas citri pv. fuscans]SOO22469.1 hypothetical protein XFF6991_150230 [Xanthomonas phaseoli pv. phaseoli]SOO35963.1 hypothetical protein XFF6994_690008 [Xanthomonas citri pv. fuscans]